MSAANHRHPKQGDTVKTTFVAQGSHANIANLKCFLTDGIKTYPGIRLRRSEGNNRYAFLFHDVERGDYVLILKHATDIRSIDLTVVPQIHLVRRANERDPASESRTYGAQAEESFGANTQTYYPTATNPVQPDVTAFGFTNAPSSIANAKMVGDDTSEVVGTVVWDPASFGGMWGVHFAGLNTARTYTLNVGDDTVAGITVTA